MSKNLVFNGNVYSESDPVLKASNRAFLYGDGVFETFRVFKGIPLFITDHWSRLTSGLQVLKIQKPESFNVQRLQFHIRNLVKENGIEDGARARISMFRNPGGKYTPVDMGMSYTLQLEGLKNPFFELNKQGRSLGVFTEFPRLKNPLSSFKTLNCHASVMGGIWAQENGFDEALLVNGDGEIIEATSGNLFWVKEGKVFTPPNNTGAVAGITRMHIVNYCIQATIPCFEMVPTEAVLLEADEIFTTNAIQGVQWINRYKDKRYFNKFSKYFIDQLNESMINSWKDLRVIE